MKCRDMILYGFLNILFINSIMTIICVLFNADYLIPTALKNLVLVKSHNPSVTVWHSVSSRCTVNRWEWRNYFIRNSLGMIHIWRPWKLSSFQDPPPPCPSTSKILLSPWPWTPPSPKDNQSIKTKWMAICYQVLPSTH